ncbi:Rho GTPase-activating 32 [Rhynchospora pubera]|uniref:Rho GTPase-activating 32 n=1 Tax=Rhynchospora pubera TaxID=906938 RepID=A0AAV8CKM2_9POAL|nr:Rho GTPase-activating 32 [Rhynchospora pubera]
MADFPSFSLGLGLDSDEEEEEELNGKIDCIDKQQPSVPERESNFPSFDLFLEEQLGLDQEIAPDSDLDCEEPRAFKRLRRGGASSVSSITGTETPARVSLGSKEPNQPSRGVGGSEIFSSLEDEIEEFSSQEEPQIQDGYMRSAVRDASSSSKVSLRNQGVLTSQSTTKIKTQKTTQNPISSTSSNLEKSEKTKLLPKLTISPLRKLHMLDTDSDSDPCSDFGFDEKKNESKMGKEKEKVSIATPALDEFCKDYFRLGNDQDAPLKTYEAGTSVCSSRLFDPVEFTKDFEDILPEQGSSSELFNKDFPCYKYFYHSDARIRALVKERLPHFAPIVMVNGRGNAQNRGQNLDYMQQFGSKENAKSRKLNIKERKDSAPTDVGKRRVTASAQKAGHWFTQEGRRVYVTKDGKELSGQLAYRQYRKESGAKFSKNKKRGSGNGKKRGSSNRKKGKQ